MRTNDTVARFGGDEFAVLLNDVRAVSDLVPTVDRIQAMLAAPMTFGSRTVFVNAAVGIAVSLTDYGSAEDLLGDADAAMYQAKAIGHGSSVIFDETMRGGAMQRLQLQSDLRQAVAEEQFELHYQPLVDLDTRQVVGLEALIRWAHPQRGEVSPGDFLAVAETTGLTVPIGRWTIREVCRQIAQWRTAVPMRQGLAVSVNLSNRQFWDPELRSYVREAMAEFGVPPSAVVFEVTEGVIMHNPDAAGTVMRQLHDEPFKLHVDDFGTGHSSLESLHKFPIDALKIDGSFTARMGIDIRSRELVRTMISMGGSLGVDVIAEGIETEEQASMLAEMGCRTGQGYLFSRAVPAAHVPALLLQAALPTAT
jgi:EAL domain-containing protein (putative c-di-GMP-specific phosphodiesterase class I)